MPFSVCINRGVESVKVLIKVMLMSELQSKVMFGTRHRSYIIWRLGQAEKRKITEDIANEVERWLFTFLPLMFPYATSSRVSAHDVRIFGEEL